MSGDEESDGAVRRVDWGSIQRGNGRCEVVDITTKAGIVITVHISPEGRSVRVFKRKPGKRSHELKVVAT